MEEDRNTAFYQLLCKTYPEASIFLLGVGGKCVHDFKGEYARFKGVISYSLMKEAGGVPLEESTWIKVSLPLEGKWQVFLFFPWSYCQDAFLQARMVETLYRAFMEQGAKRENVAEGDDNGLLLYQIFGNNNASEKTYTSLLAAKHSIDLTRTRLVCLLQWDKGFVEGEKIYRTIKAQTKPQDLYGSYGDNIFVYCPTSDPKSFDTHGFRREMESLLETIAHGKEGMVAMGVGFFATSLGEYPLALSAARKALEKARGRRSVVFANDYVAQNLLSLIPQNTLAHFLEPKARYFLSNPLLLDTAKALLENEMDLANAANALGVHRNTVTYRLSRIKEELDLNPLHEDNDRFALALYLLYAERLTQGKPAEVQGLTSP